LPKYRVFVAYGGSGASAIAVDMVRCLRTRKLRLFIAFPGLKESINLSSEEDILAFERTCDAVFAVSTDGSGQSPKFRDEIESVKYDETQSIPVIAFLKKDASDMLLALQTGCTHVRFDYSLHLQKCSEAALTIRRQIQFLRHPQIVSASRNLRRRSPK